MTWAGRACTPSVAARTSGPRRLAQLAVVVAMLASRPTSAALAQDAADAARPSGDAGRVAALARAEDLSRQVFRLFRADRFREAEPLAREALRIRELHLPPDSEAVAQAVLNLGAQLHGQARWSEARPLYERALARRAGVRT